MCNNLSLSATAHAPRAQLTQALKNSDLTSQYKALVAPSPAHNYRCVALASGAVALDLSNSIHALAWTPWGVHGWAASRRRPRSLS